MTGEIPRNEWRRLELAVRSTVPQLDVSVIIPAFNCQEELECTLASLSVQTYAPERLQVVVVDDGSDPPLRVNDSEGASGLAADLRVVRQERVGFGAGRARNAGAQLADGDLIVFLDADLVADPGYVEAHTRWHQLLDYVVTLGTRTFVSFEGLSPADVRVAADDGDTGLSSLLKGRATTPHQWVEDVMAQTRELTADRDDLFRAVVGAGVGVSRAFLQETRGFPEFGLRGAEDIVFGWRLFTAGAVLTPVRSAHAWHQGKRTFDQADVAALKRVRAPRMADHLPQRPYRPVVAGRSYAVPMVHVTVPASDRAADRVIETVNSILGNTLHDLHVHLRDLEHHPEAQLLRHTFEFEPRVTFEPHPHWSESAILVTASAGCMFAPSAITWLLNALNRRKVAFLHVVVRGHETEPPNVEVRRTRAQRRASWIRRRWPSVEEDELIPQLFGEWWEDGDLVLVADTAARAHALEAAAAEGSSGRNLFVGPRASEQRLAGPLAVLRTLLVKVVMRLRRHRLARPIIEFTLRLRRRRVEARTR